MSGANIDMIVCKGGLDQITPTLSLPNTYARQALNFEAAVTGGYNRIAGYERADGNMTPTALAASSAIIVLEIDHSVALPLGIIGGNDATCVATGARATVMNVVDWTVYMARDNGIEWEAGDLLTRTAHNDVGIIADVPAFTPETQAIAKNYVTDFWRDQVHAPGEYPSTTASGRILGVVEFNDKVYAFRHNLLGTAVNIYATSGATGWTNVPLLKTVSFTVGLTEPTELTCEIAQGGVTARIRRVVRTSGSWLGGDAAGYFIIDTVAGGNFTANPATTRVISGGAAVGSMSLSGIQTQITLAPHTASTTKFEFEERNFYGQASTNRVYGCDGVNKAFEFDGEILVPITTGAAVDKPTHLATHKGFLFLSIGSSIIHSAPGLPYCFAALENAGELATGGDITGLISMPGGTNTATLGVTTRTNTLILYGTGPSDWNLTPYNTGTGARDWTLQNMSQTYVFDDRGVQSIQATLQYGNFDQSTLTNQVLPFINERINKVTCATLCRRKSQYRIFFDDGYALFITIVNGKLLGCMPVYFPNPVFCVYEGKTSTGADVIYFGSTNGMVYQMEKGTSFDGEAIDFSLSMNYSNAKSPRTLKRYRKVVPELSAPTGSFAKFNLSYALGYDSLEYEQDTGFGYTGYQGGGRWDTITWDNSFWDTKNNNVLECYMDGTAENAAIMISGSSDYVSEFTINSFMVSYTPRRLMR